MLQSHIDMCVFAASASVKSSENILRLKNEARQ